ncbi:uncharacterized protein LOC124131822 [Haliotis rufescens]|uniref:uncharacterized protein LOC124131822 n=1 Tax=Haliotis rufescens TaxID=6454 RepID=UPI00201F087E|nr:uncharacterized protein LOC124131822 [Haliotis rufescens]
MADNDLLVIQTGGTIDKDYPKRKGGYAFEIGDSAVEKMARTLTPRSSWTFRTVCRKDSQDITQEDRESMLQVCSDSPIRRILITHGTDTLIESAQFIGSHRLEKVIVLTGAFLPHTFKGSDAEFNVGFAVGCLRCLTKPGVYVAMGSQVFDSNDVSRDDASGVFVKKFVAS